MEIYDWKWSSFYAYMPTRDDVSKKIIVLEYNSDIFYIHWVPFMVLVYSCDNFDSPLGTLHEALNGRSF